jgi:methylase of polypeptide subunit release factors
MPPTDELATSSVLFGPLRIAYDESVLEPRAWTQWQSLWAAELADTAPAGRILELCSGAGQIGLLAIANADRDLVAVDLSETACRFAGYNAGVAGLADRVEIRNLPLETCSTPDEVFPIIIADPPWVPADQTGRFPEDPLSAIDGGSDGLDVARACLVVIGAHLHARGVALLQVGSVAQVDTLRTTMAPALEVKAIREEPGRGAVALIVRAD